jgi:hypothetical protein
MKTQRSIENSRRLYAWLLGLYPKEHRLEYGAVMTQLFADQCRSVQSQKGQAGMLALWLRTLLDLGKSALTEHFSTPNSRAGLLQATPGAPLPWKGVLLVAIPGLVVFISQIGQLTGKNWYYQTLAWAGYAFAIPAVLTWLLTRKFPVWGLIPLGLFLQRIIDTFLSYPIVVYYWLASGPLGNWYRSLNLAKVIAHRYQLVPVVRIALPVILLVGLIWLIARRIRFTRAVKTWLVVYFILMIVKLSTSVLLSMWEILRYMPPQIRFSAQIIQISFQKNTAYIAGNFLTAAYMASLFLLVVLISGLLARRHGRLAFLLPLGYLLPTILIGPYIGFADDPTLSVVMSLVFVYRLAIAIIAPLWIARTASRKQHTWAIIVPVFIAVAVQAGIVFVTRGEFTPIEYLAQTIMDGVMILAGAVLAITLYRCNPRQTPKKEELAAVPEPAM